MPPNRRAASSSRTRRAGAYPRPPQSQRPQRRPQVRLHRALRQDRDSRLRRRRLGRVPPPGRSRELLRPPCRRRPAQACWDTLRRWGARQRRHQVRPVGVRPVGARRQTAASPRPLRLRGRRANRTADPASPRQGGVRGCGRVVGPPGCARSGQDGHRNDQGAPRGGRRHALLDAAHRSHSNRRAHQCRRERRVHQAHRVHRHRRPRRVLCGRCRARRLGCGRGLPGGGARTSGRGDLALQPSRGHPTARGRRGPKIPCGYGRAGGS